MTHEFGQRDEEISELASRQGKERLREPILIETWSFRLQECANAPASTAFGSLGGKDESVGRESSSARLEFSTSSQECSCDWKDEILLVLVMTAAAETNKRQSEEQAERNAT